MHEIRIASFGAWGLTLDGRPAPPIRSRPARELLLLMSLRPGPVIRETVIAELWPDEPDLRRGRRRLSQELNRIQSTLGVTVWVSGRDSVDLAPGATLTSDLAELSSGVLPSSALTAPSAERERLAKLLQIPAQGRLLPGHFSDWALRRAAMAQRDELVLLERAVEAHAETDRSLALSLAERWADLEPLADRANTALLRLVHAVHGPAAAGAALGEIGRRYRAELGVAVPPALEAAAIERPGPPPGSLWGEVEDLRAEYERAEAGGSPVAGRRRVLVELDDRLRMTGHHYRRLDVARQLRALDHEAIDVAWREAEIAAVDNERDRVDELIAESGPLDPQHEAHAMLLLVGGQSALNDGETEAVAATVRSIVDRTRSPLVSLEARVLLGRLAELRHDFVEADSVLVQACGDAEQQGLAYHEALAKCALGWARVNAGDHHWAEQLLTQAMEQARSLGAESVEAAASGGIGYLSVRRHRFGSALAAMERAASIAGRIGDARSQMRWQLNAAGVALTFGDARTARAHADQVTSACERTGATPPYWLEAVRCDLLEYEGGDNETVVRALQELTSVSEVAGNRLFGFHVRADVVRRLLELGRHAEALGLAEQNMAMVDDGAVADHWGVMARAYLGAAKVAVGDAADGIGLLRRAAADPQAGVDYPYLVHVWHHEAASSLGLAEEAEAAAVRLRHLVLAIKADLTDDQWRIALDNMPGVRPVMALLPDAR